MTLLTCPAEQDLRAFHLGDLPGPAVDMVAEHLESCMRCEKRMRALEEHTDPLLKALRGISGEVVAVATPASLDSVRVDDLASVSGPGAPEEATLQEIQALLAPPQGPGELGWLAHYRLLRLLGQGGMGLVFQAEDTHLQRLVALKIMKPQLARDFLERQRFLREARAMAAVRDEHVVAVYQVGQDRDVPYVAMEYLEGQSLERWLPSGQALAPRQVLRIGREVAQGLAAFHALQLVHRDIKPANLWLEGNGGSDFRRVKILDFGLARKPDDGELTQTGMVVGTPAYMAPEQAKAEKVDGRADLFSLGCVLYRLCTGQAPFQGNNATALMIAAATEPVRPITELNPQVPPALSDLVNRLLAKRPADRIDSAATVLTLLHRIERSLPAVDQQTETMHALATPPLLPSLPGSGQRRRPVQRRGAAALVALAVGGAWWLIAHGIGPATFVARETRPQPTQLRPLSPAEAEWRQQVAAMKPDEQFAAVKARLQELNPKFDGVMHHRVEDDAVTELGFASRGVTDISPVRALPKLRILTCGGDKDGYGDLADLAPLEGMALDRLYVHQSKVKDLTPLKNMPLTVFWGHLTKIADLEPLRGMKLKEVRLNGTEINSLAPLKGMPLELLWCGFSKVTDLSPLQGMPLEQLECEALHKVTSLKVLEAMPLKMLICHNGTPIADWSVLNTLPDLEDLSGEFKPDRDRKVLETLRRVTRINGKPSAEFLQELGKN